MAQQRFCFLVLVPLLAACGVGLAGHLACATDVTATWDGSIGDWSDAAHWDSVFYPENGNGGLTYEAVISSGNVTVDIPITIDGLDFSNGVITTEDDLTVAIFNWLGGRFQGTGDVDVAGGTFSGGGVKYLDQTMRLGGDVDWDSGTMSWSTNQGTLQVTAGNTFTASGTTDLNFYPILQVDAGGTFALTRTGRTTMSGPLSNEGLVDVAAGELRLTVDTTAGGDFSIASTATLQVGGGTHVYTGNFSGDGLMRFAAGATRFESPASYTVAHTEVFGGSVDFDTGATINSLDWSAGRFQGTGVVDVAGGTFRGGTKYLDQTMRLVGDVDWDSGTMTWSTNQGTLQVTAGNTFTASGTTVLNFYPILQVDAGGSFDVLSTGTTTMWGPLNNEGLVDVAAGELRLTVDTTAGGDFSIASTATLQMRGGTHAYTGNFSGDGLMRFAAGATRFESPASYTVAYTEVTGGIVEFDTGATVSLGVLPFTSGQIGGSDDLMITSLDWSGGRFQGMGVVDVAGGTFRGGTKYLDQTMRLVGDVDWDSGTMSWSTNQGTLQVTAGNTFTASGTTDLNSYPILQVDAGGTFALTRTGTTTMSGPLNNEGLVDVAAGELRLTVDTTAGGDFSIASTATLQVGGGTHVYTGNFSGDGLMQFTGGTTRFESPASYTVANTVVAGGVVEFDTGATITALDWSAGRFRGTSVVDVAGGTFRGGTKYLDQTMRLVGDVEWDSGTMSWSTSQGTLQVTAGNTFTASGTTDLSFFPVLQVDAGGSFAMLGTGTTTMWGPLNNEGLVDVAAGELRLTVDTTAGGDFSIASPATLQVGGGTHAYAGNFSGDGLMRFAAGATRFESPASYTVAHTEVSGGSVDFDTGATINLGVLPFTSGRIGGSDDLVITSLDWSAGRFQGTGVVDVSGGTFRGSTKYLDQTMRLVGDVDWDSGTMTWSSNQGTLQVAAGNTFTASGTTNLSFGPNLRIDAGGTLAATNTAITTINGNLVNDGTVHVRESTLTLAGGGSGGGTFLIDADRTLRFQSNTFNFSGSLDVTDAATVELSSASVTADPIFVQPGGLIVGSGTLDSPTQILNNGVIRGTSGSQLITFEGGVRGTGTLANVRIRARHEPGASPAIVNLEGRYSLTTASTLAIEIGGQTPGVEHDRLESIGDIQLAGTLEIEQIDLGEGIFQPEFGDAFVIARAEGALTGTFGQVETIGLNPALTYDTFYDYETGVVTVGVSSFFDSDFDLDADVDGDDFLIWQLNFLTVGDATHFDGDANADGDVDGEDFLVWQNQFGASVGGGQHLAPAAVPEPLTGALLLVVMTAAIARRRGMCGVRFEETRC